jgi:hypothetical protein
LNQFITVYHAPAGNQEAGCLTDAIVPVIILRTQYERRPAMEKFVPIEKRTKKTQREIHAGRRGTWGGLNPVTRKPENPKAYSRKKARKWSDDSSMTVPFIYKVYSLENQCIK